MKSINKLITHARKTLSASTDSTLCISPVRGTIQFYSVHKGIRHYIPKKNAQELTKLAQKRYTTEVLRIAEKNRKILTDFINRYDEHACERYYDSIIPELKKYTKSLIQSDDEYAEQWARTEYRTKGIKEGETEYSARLAPPIR